MKELLIKSIITIVVLIALCTGSVLLQDSVWFIAWLLFVLFCGAGWMMWLEIIYMMIPYRWRK